MGMGEDVMIGYDRELVCPNCEGLCLHHEQVEVFTRRAEDSEDGARVVCGGDRTVSISPSIEGNPSRRRGGLRVRFRCENCENLPVLILVQHKGSTYLEWEGRDGPDRRGAAER